METQVESRKTYIYLQVSGEFNPKDRNDLDGAKRAILEAFQKMKENRIFNLLVNAGKVSTVMDTLDRYYLMSSLAKVQYDFIVENRTQPFKMAFVTNRAWSDPQKFDELVSRNRGADVFITLDIQEALNWLQVKEPPQD